MTISFAVWTEEARESVLQAFSMGRSPAEFLIRSAVAELPTIGTPEPLEAVDNPMVRDRAKTTPNWDGQGALSTRCLTTRNPCAVTVGRMLRQASISPNDTSIRTPRPRVDTSLHHGIHTG